MPAYNFQKQFAPDVKSGKKQQTIRKTAKGARFGAIAYLYTGQRTAQCEKLGEGVIFAVRHIEIGRRAGGEPYACITDSKISPVGARGCLDLLAQDDGFQDGEEMVEWFAAQYGLPFEGFLIEWSMISSSAKGL